MTVFGRSVASTAVPSNASVPLPLAGSVSTFTLDNASPMSVSANSNSAAENVCPVSSSIVTSASEAVGAALADVSVVAATVSPGPVPTVLIADTR